MFWFVVLENMDIMVLYLKQSQFEFFFRPKSKFDDYYEFELGRTPNNDKNNRQNGNSDDSELSVWKEFTIIRPMEEGQMPCLATGYTALADVRGSSGTSVTLYLQPQYQHWTTPQGVRDVLLPMLTKILETTPYTLVVEGIVSPQEAQALLEASENEEQIIASLANCKLEATTVADGENDTIHHRYRRQYLQCYFGSSDCQPCPGAQNRLGTCQIYSTSHVHGRTRIASIGRSCHTLL
jgi:hypothetical protein